MKMQKATKFFLQKIDSRNWDGESSEKGLEILILLSGFGSASEAGWGGI
jgi:hypothetical protein